jgi:restriction system protein
LWSAEEAARRVEQERLRRELAEDARKREYLLSLSPEAFEEHIGKLFSALGYNVKLTQKSHDEGVDLYLEKNGRRAIVQCKHYTHGNVSRPGLQQIFGVLRHKRASEAFVVTTGGFSRQAREFAEGKPMHLIDLLMLVQMAESAFTEEFIRSGPSGKTRRAPHLG